MSAAKPPENAPSPFDGYKVVRHERKSPDERHSFAVSKSIAAKSFISLFAVIGHHVIDYLQQMRGSTGRRKPRMAETAEVAGCLKETAEELNVSVIALSSLDWKKTGYYSRPRIGDLRYAPEAIEENADVICLMWRRDENVEGDTIVTVAKNSKGQTGDVRFNMSVTPSADPAK